MTEEVKSPPEVSAKPAAPAAPDAVAAPAGSSAPAGAPKQGILSLTIKDKGALYAAYMPFVKGGGLFVPTNKTYKLGEEVFMLVKLMEETEKMPVVGKVVWKTPVAAQGNRVSGIGVQFAADKDGEVLRNKIEGYLAGALKSDRITHTM